MSDILDVEQVRAMATPAGALWAGERAPTALALARTALEWSARWSTVHAAEEARDLAIAERDEAYKQRDVQASRVLGMGSMFDDLRTILGATDGEMLSDAARRVTQRIDEVHTILEAPPEMAVETRAKFIMQAIGMYRKRADGAEAEPPQEDLREILRARDGEPLGDAARRLAASRDEMMEEASRARTELGARTNESAKDAALRVMRSLLKAQSALGEVFEIQHEITVAGDLVTIRVAPLRDPAIRSLPLGVRLGLVVCDD